MSLRPAHTEDKIYNLKHTDMKKLIIAFAALFCITVSARAMSYEQAREQALFLTDKMAYELNLTDDQYEAAYEINLDYLMSIDDYNDLYGLYWQQRNLDLSYILLDWQYRAYCAANYFYRPLYWDAGYWHFGIYARYPHRDYFFYGRPDFYAYYRGNHSWRMNGGSSWYHGRSWGGPRPGEDRRFGMRDGFNRGDYGRGITFGNRGNGYNNVGNRSFGNQNRPAAQQNMGNRSFGNQSRNSFPSNRSFGNTSGYNGNRSFGNMPGSPRRSFVDGSIDRQSSTRTTVTNGNPGIRSFGNSSRPSTTPNQTFTPRSTPSPSPGTRSFGGTSRQFGGGSTGSSNGSSPFGGHR